MTLLTPTTPATLSSEKVQERHRDRLAVVYVRQSTPQQIEQHPESTRLQYQLAERACQFGWSPDRVLVIDEDLGRSAASACDRPGFQRLVTEVGLGHVGMIVGIEVSRLARSCKDWYQLLEICALFDTLIADMDGVYDASLFNDRLLLGLKGTIFEAELHVLNARMQQGRMAKARRGELSIPLPRGFVRQASGEVTLDPDEQVRAAIQLVFDVFEQRRSVSGVLRYLVDHDIQLPDRIRKGEHKGDLRWNRPNRGTLTDMLHHPAYAGAFVYGRRHADPRRRKPGQPYSGRTLVRDPQCCPILIPNLWPAYIDWSRFERNQEQMAANRTENLGVPGGGSALLSGLVRCGRCGLRMGVFYRSNGREARYRCGSAAVTYGDPECQSLQAWPVDDYVGALILEALTPSAIDVSLQLAEDIELERRQQYRQWDQRLERARYEVELAQRRYEAAEPENRLVTRTLERAWEAALAAQQQLQTEHARFTAQQPRRLEPEEQAAIRRLAADIPAVWRAPTTTMADRQAIARLMLEQVTITVLEDSEYVDLQCHWAGGTCTQDRMIRPVRDFEQLHDHEKLIEEAGRLRADGLDYEAVAAHLNAKGWHPARGRTGFTRRIVEMMMNRCGGPLAGPPKIPQDRGPTEVTIHELSEILSVPRGTLGGWIRRGVLSSRRAMVGRHPVRLVQADATEIQRLTTYRLQHGSRRHRRHHIEER